MQCCISVLFLFQISIAWSYKVAVVDYYYENYNNFADNIKHNLQNILKLVNDTVENTKNMDLIVLPEAAIVRKPSYSKEEILSYASFIPDKNSIIIPCLDTDNKTQYYVQALSCASMQHKVYISADVVEKTASELFNTNIVFNRQGMIVSKYRKRHLFNEPYISNHTQEVEYFTTDFGITFGVFICFDILFKDSYQELLDKQIAHFIFPSFWFSALPYLTSMQMQRMWSFKHNVTVLASDINQALTGSGGSGIYFGRGDSISYLSSESYSKVLWADVPRNETMDRNHFRNLNKFMFFKDNTTMHIYPLNNYDANTNIQEKKCYDDFCCLFKLNVNDTKGLAITIFNGRQNFAGFATLGLQICSIVQCQTEKNYECTSMPENHYFEKSYQQLEVQVVHRNNDTEYYPNIALQDLQFLSINNFSFDDNTLQLKLTQESRKIYNFGFFGRNYKLDEM